MGGEKIDDILFSSAHVGEKANSTKPTPTKRAVRFEDKTIDANAGSRVLRPGTKKYKRFLNVVELLSDSEGEEIELEVEYTVEYRSPFTIIFEDEDFREKWDPFIDITEEEEANLLALLGADEAFRKEKQQKKKNARDTTVPSACWRNLGKYAKKTIFAHHDSPVFETMDKRMIDFVLSRGNQKTFSLTTHFQRVLCHCIAPYYSMTAHTTKSGATYRTTVTKTKATQLPSSSLSQFIVYKLAADPLR